MPPQPNDQWPLQLHRNFHHIDGRYLLNEFQRFEPTTIIPGHGDPGGIDIALNLASHIETVRRGVNALRTKGMSADDIIRSYKPAIVASTPNWEHAFLIDGEIRYLAAQQA